MSLSNVRRGRPKGLYHKVEGKSLFAGVKAWFSSSVGQRKKVAWINHGGTCCNWKEAQLLFSENHKARDTTDNGRYTNLSKQLLQQTIRTSFKSPETLLLFEQMEFLWGYVTVFHASFISACIKEKNMQKVSIAPYLILPPEFPLVDIKDIPSSICPTAESSNGSDKDEDKQILTRRSKRHKRRLEFSQQRSSQSVLCNADKDRSTTFSTNRTNDPCGSCDKSFRFCNGVEEDCIENNVPLLDLESIPHASSLKRTSQRLSDFVPYQNGCAVSRKV